MNHSLNFAPSLAYALVALIGGVVVAARSNYLIRASRHISVEEGLAVTLKPAKWAYLVPAYIIGIGFVFGSFLFGEPLPGVIICGGIGLFCIAGGLWWMRSLSNSAVTISDGRRVYREGKSRTEFALDEVYGVSFAWFTFRVRLAWQRQVAIPATFDSSEVILAFLRAGCAKHRSTNGKSQ